MPSALDNTGDSPLPVSGGLPAVESAAPAVVNVYASRLYQEKKLSVFQNPSLRSLFGIPPMLKKTHKNSSIGSGVIMNKEGYILTNAHVVQDAQEIGVTLNSGFQLQAKLIGLDVDTDLAVLKINLKDPPTIPIGNSSKLKIQLEGSSIVLKSILNS